MRVKTVVISMLFVLSACGIQPSGGRTDTESRPGGSFDGTCQKPAALTDTAVFLEDIKLIISNKCGFCHNAAALPDNRRKPYLVEYDVAKSYATRMVERMERTGAGKMPPEGSQPHLEQRDIERLKLWIAGGYIEKPVLPTIDQNKPIYYDPEIKNLMDSQCVRCHQPGLQYPYLNAYDDVKDASERSKIRIDDGTMPSEGALPDDLKKAFSLWISRGSPRSAEDCTH